MKKVKLGEVLESYIDYRGKTPKKLGEEWSSTGYRALSALQVKTEGLQNMDKCYFASEKLYEKWMKEEVEKGDILLTSEAPAGQVYYWNSDEKIVLSQRLFCLKIKKLYDARYIKYYLQSDMGQREIFNNNTGSTAKGISAKTFNNINVLVRGLENEQKIAAILSSLDDKIETNNKIVSVLEKMMKEIYNYWFVQFDFPDKNGKPYQASGGEMVWNKELKRKIPAAWGITTIGSITKCHDSKRIPVSNKVRETMKGDIPYYGATGIMGYVNKAIFSGDYVLLAEDGSVMDNNGNPIVQRVSGNVWINNHAHVLEPIKEYSCRLLMLILKDIPVVQIKTGSIQMKINQENMNKYKIVDIPNYLIKKINNYLVDMDKLFLSLRVETQTLTALRDFLLPLLMNGQASVQ